MNGKKLLAVLMALCMAFALVAACGSSAPAPAPAAPEAPAAPDAPAAPAEPDAPAAPADDGSALPRNETLYFNGLQWGTSNGWNVFGDNMNNPLVNDSVGSGARVPMMETPYMYNPLDNKMYPLLADGDVDGYQWNADMTELTFKIKPAARWSDGTPVTAHDVAASYMYGFDYTIGQNGAFRPFIEEVVAVDDATVKVVAVKTADGKPTNPLMMITYLTQNYVFQKAWLDDLIARHGGDVDAIASDPADDIVYSGPYGPYIRDETMTAVIRNDDYWGQDASMWGRLPVPKYLAHVIFADNAAGDAALMAGEVDVSQQFIANVQLMWLEQGLPISTYIDVPPYGLCVNMPTAYFNMEMPVFRDNPELRRAIAMAVDYDMINANAMTGQSPTFAEVPRSLMAPPPGEQAMYDRAAIAAKDLQWVGNQLDEANALLDESGKFPIGDDGFRTYNGEKMSFKALCPYGWSDWEAAMEIVAAAGAGISIEITTEFPDWDVYQVDVTTGNLDGYEIFMMWTASTDPTQPWGRARMLMSNEWIDDAVNWNGNWGKYSNPRVQELIAAIPLESSNAALIEMYTELVEIYLTDIPSFSLMYRPDKFHTVNESVWTGFTDSNDGRNVPPVNCISGYAIADLYNLRLVG